MINVRPSAVGARPGWSRHGDLQQFVVQRLVVVRADFLGGDSIESFGQACVVLASITVVVGDAAIS